MHLGERLVTPVLDGLLVLASFLLAPVLGAPFAAPHWEAVLLVFLAYNGMCAGMWLIKLVERPAAAARKPRPGKTGEEEEGGGCLGFFSLSFAVFALAMMLFSIGLGEGGATSRAWERGPQDHPVLAIIIGTAMLAWICIFPGVAVATPKPVLPRGTPRALIARSIGVLAVNAMLLLSACWWQAILGGGEGLAMSLGGRVILFVCYYTIFLMCYAAPRLALIAVEGDRLSLATFLVSLAFIVWPLAR